jgi:hypothetical protein
MAISSSVSENPTGVSYYARGLCFLRWILVIPAYFVSGITAFLFAWFGIGGPLGVADDGSSWFSIFIVLFATFVAVTASALVVPRFKLIVALLAAVLTICLVPHPYDYQTSGDGESIPSMYELIGTLMGGILALAVVLLKSSSAPRLLQQARICL